VPLLEKEFRNAAKRLEDTQEELNDLNPQKYPPPLLPPFADPKDIEMLLMDHRDLRCASASVCILISPDCPVAGNQLQRSFHFFIVPPTAVCFCMQRRGRCLISA